MSHSKPYLSRLVLPAVAALGLATSAPAFQLPPPPSAARQWNDMLLESIRKDFARPPIHARNLFHLSIAMWDAWAVYDFFDAQPILLKEDHGTSASNVDALRSEALSYASYALLRARFAGSPGAALMLPKYDELMATLGYDKNKQSTIGNSPSAIGNRIAVAVLAFGLADNSNEQDNFKNRFYKPINEPLVPPLPGNPTITDPNRWQPLALEFFVDQGGNVILGGYPDFIAPEWGQVSNFALSLNDLTIYQRDGFDYFVYHDPGPPPFLGTSSAADYKNTFEMVTVWQSHHDPSDGVVLDISPASTGNATLPNSIAEYAQFYDFDNGGDSGQGYALNPVTGQPYTPQIVPRGDYTRVLAEFWADGPNSETPPGHWFDILNKDVSDNILLEKRLGGVGPIVDDLEWDVKAYLALGGAMHDTAVACWGIKGWYDYVRPISAIRYMAGLGQSSDSSAPNFHPDGITLRPGFIETVTPESSAPGQRHAHLAASVGKIALFTWRGPDFIPVPATDTAGVGWILADNWYPYQRPTFVTPPFAGYTSGHSTYSRAAATVLATLTGSPFFPGGLGEFNCPKNEFLVFEDGPSQTVTLQWAKYTDASDQCSLSRIWGGIHPAVDDIPGRVIGAKIGADAYERAEQYWNGQACELTDAIRLYGAGCDGGGAVIPRLSMDGCPTPGGKLTTQIASATPQSVALLAFGFLEAGIPFGGACNLLVTPLVVILPIALDGTPGVPGSGSAALVSTLSQNIPTGSALKLQAAIIDLTTPQGFTLTNGVSVSIQ